MSCGYTVIWRKIQRNTSATNATAISTVHQTLCAIPILKENERTTWSTDAAGLDVDKGWIQKTEARNPTSTRVIEKANEIVCTKCQRRKPQSLKTLCNTSDSLLITAPGLIHPAIILSFGIWCRRTELQFNWILWRQNGWYKDYV